ncbi:MAG: TSUP family transporter [Phycisphaeraceae bacterium]|nr:TSUP family transporter [Phycisphaeraceae bacterium]
MTIQENLILAAWLVPIGLAAGFLGLAVRSGGVLLLVPFLAVWYPTAPVRYLAGMGLLLALLCAVVGVGDGVRRGEVKWPAAKWLLIAALVMGAAGAVATRFLSRIRYDMLLGLMLMSTAAYLLAKAGGGEPAAAPLADLAAAGKLKASASRTMRPTGNPGAALPGAGIPGVIPGVLPGVMEMISGVLSLVGGFVGAGVAMAQERVLERWGKLSRESAAATAQAVVLAMTLAGVALSGPAVLRVHGIRQLTLMTMGVLGGALLATLTRGRIRGRWVEGAMGVVLGAMGAWVILAGINAGVSE